MHVYFYLLEKKINEKSIFYLHKGNRNSSVRVLLKYVLYYLSYFQNSKSYHLRIIKVKLNEALDNFEGKFCYICTYMKFYKAVYDAQTNNSGSRYPIDSGHVGRMYNINMYNLEC